MIETIRQCPFRRKAAAMLDVLSTTRTDGTALLRRLRSDAVLGPFAIQALLTDGLLDQEALSEQEQVLGLTEQLIQALEVAGPETVREMVLAGSSPNEAMNVVAAALESGHPAGTGLDELRALVAEPLRQQTLSRRHGHPLAVSRAHPKPTRTR